MANFRGHDDTKAMTILMIILVALMIILLKCCPDEKIRHSHRNHHYVTFCLSL